MPHILPNSSRITFGQASSSIARLFRGPRRSSDKVIKSIIAENDQKESFHDFDKNKNHAYGIKDPGED
eukprot:Awhi_evm1s2660